MNRPDSNITRLDTRRPLRIVREAPPEAHRQVADLDAWLNRPRIHVHPRIPWPEFAVCMAVAAFIGFALAVML